MRIRFTTSFPTLRVGHLTSAWGERIDRGGRGYSRACSKSCRASRLGNTLALPLALTLIGFATSALAQSDSARVDHLFRLASEGNVRYRDMVEPAKDSLAKMGERSAPWLARKLNTTDARERLTLADIFEKMGKVATPFIVPYLDSAGEDYPKNSARALERIKDTAAVLPLLAQMDHPIYSVRSQVATALGKTGDRRAVQKLIEHLTLEHDADVRKSCAVALGGIGDPRATCPLSMALEDVSYGVRQTAIIALAQLKPPPTNLQTIHSCLRARGNIIPRDAVRNSGIAIGSCGTDRAALLKWLASDDYLYRGFAVEGLSLNNPQKSEKAIAQLKSREIDPFVLAQIARFELILADMKNEQAKPK